MNTVFYLNIRYVPTAKLIFFFSDVLILKMYTYIVKKNAVMDR